MTSVNVVFTDQLIEVVDQAEYRKIVQPHALESGPVVDDAHGPGAGNQAWRSLD